MVLYRNHCQKPWWLWCLGGGAASTKSAPHMHVVVGICSNFWQFSQVMPLYKFRQ